MNLKKSGILLCMMCLAVFTTIAQTDTCVYNYGKFNDGAKVFLFADKVNIRKADSPNSAILCNLSIGTPMTIISASEKSYALNGIAANWYQVGFYFDGKYNTGYVWGNMISHASIPFSEDGENCLFVCAPVSRSEEDGLKMTAKIISKGEIINSLSFTPIYTEMSGSGTFEYCLSGSRLDKSGFTGVSKIFAVSFEYGACDYANGDILFFRAGNNLVEFAKAIRVSEAGIFNVSYNYIFPQNKGGVDNTLYIEECHVEYDPDKEDITITSDVTYKRKIFWDGKKAIESEKKELNNLKEVSR